MKTLSEYAENILYPVVLNDKTGRVFAGIESCDDALAKDFIYFGPWLGDIPKGLFQSTLKRVLNILLKDLLFYRHKVSFSDNFRILIKLPNIETVLYHPLESILSIAREAGFKIESMTCVDYLGDDIIVFKLVLNEDKNSLSTYISSWKSLDFWKEFLVRKLPNGKRDIMAKLEFKIVGINKDQEYRKTAWKVVKNFPGLQKGEGKRPKIELKCVNFQKGNYRNPDAVAVGVIIKKKFHQIGWLAAREDSDNKNIIPDKFISRFLQSDKYYDVEDKIINSVKLARFGTFYPRGSETKNYFGALEFILNLDNLEIMKSAV